MTANLKSQLSQVYTLASLITFSRDIDLLNPPAKLEKTRHKLKQLTQSPNSFFMRTSNALGASTCNIGASDPSSRTTISSHSQTVVVCGNCQTVLCQPTGGRTRLTEGCSFRRKGNWRLPATSYSLTS